MTNGLSKTQKLKKEEKTQDSVQKEGLSFRSIEREDMGTGVVGRSSVKVDNLDTDIARLKNNYDFAKYSNDIIDYLVNQGYNYDEVVSAVYDELGLK